MAKPKTIGSINCFSASRAKFRGENFIFNGTTLDLVRESISRGAKAGDTIEANYGGGFRPYIIEAAPHDMRAGGYWIS